jgi:hypothetical protein
MAKVFSRKTRRSVWPAAAGALLVLLSAGSVAAQGRGAKAQTEAQQEEAKEMQPARALGASTFGDPNDPTYRPVATERRGGLVVGFALGAAVGSAAGFPNDPTKIGLIKYYTETSIGAGFSGRIWLGAALRDWLTVGLGFGGAGLSAGDKVYFSGNAGFHLEIFPLWSLGGRLRDAGVMVQTGVGSGIVTPAKDQKTLLVDGGLTSSVGLGVTWEGLRLGKVAMGPYLEYEYMYGSSLRGGQFVLGWRSAFYQRP